MLLENRVALITGGAKGMGKSMAYRFAEEGCKVAIADVSIEEARENIAGIEKQGGTGMALECDVTNIARVKEVVDTVLKEYGKVDILVNNAGGMPDSPPIEDITEEEWDKVFALNLKSDFFFCKYLVPQMKENHYGKIVNLSSIGAINPPAHAIHYNTAKAAIIGFTYDLARALAPHNVCVNAILPGPVRTSFYDRTIRDWSDVQKDEFFDNLGKNNVPMGRVGTPEEIANTALFLASELSSFITGETILVSGGLPLSQ
ncbi:MAG: SDR family oxidoreductase [Dehalococcoidales bacterium]|nr:SDR family oxidoreductase [Dehalococcoidales bacterium]